MAPSTRQRREQPLDQVAPRAGVFDGRLDHDARIDDPESSSPGGQRLPRLGEPGGGQGQRNALGAGPDGALPRVLEAASRLGYAARGVVYLGVGAAALAAAVDVVPRARGAKATLASWAMWPFGPPLILAIAAGLLGFAAWRAVQAGFDADRHGASPKGVAVRTGQAVSGLIYGGLGLWTLALLDEVQDAAEADEDGAARQTAAAVLTAPHGDLLLILAGAALIAVAIGNLVQGAAQDFSKRLGCGQAVCRLVVPLARLGYGARGAALMPAGIFVIKAGLDARSAEVRSWGGALQALEAQPLGSWILAILALGLMAFGLFGLVEARFRRIRPPTELA